MSGKTGQGDVVFATAPTLINPVVGTQSSGDNSTKAASTAYVDAAAGAISHLVPANNLSDVVSASTSRTNLGLGTAATHPSGDFLLTANNLSDVTAATGRSNLSAAAKAQTFAIGGFITSPASGTFDVVGLAPAAFGGTLTKFTGVLISGSCTMTLNINGTPVTNGVLSASTTRSSVSPSAANVFAAADILTVVSSSPSTPSQFFYTLEYTRTLA